MSFIYLLLAKFGMRLTIMQVLNLKLAGNNENDSENLILLLNENITCLLEVLSR